jgi:molybdate transport system substrate-binding protein
MRRFIRFALALTILACFRSVAPAAALELHIAAASNLNHVLPELTALFERQTQIHVIPSYGATAQLAQQAESGAPWDVFLAADREHVDQLVKEGLAASSVIYARGKLAVWAPRRPDLHTLDQLGQPDVKFIIVAKPELAPYGAAALEAMKATGLWVRAFSKIVYASNVATAKEFADTGNGDAAFTALALIVNPKDPAATGHYFLVPENLYKPIDQAMCVMKSSKEAQSAQKFFSFMQSADVRAILERYGYGQP